MRNKIYTGVGSRDVPEDIYKLLQALGRKLATQGYALRSGGAVGCDTAFYEGCKEVGGMSTIFVPWSGFNSLFGENIISLSDMPSNLIYRAEWEARQVHPAFDKLTQGAKKLHTRNVFQVLGVGLGKPSDFLVCYAPTQGNSVKGGTRTAVELAKVYGVPVYNVFDSKDRLRVELFVQD